MPTPSEKFGVFLALTFQDCLYQDYPHVSKRIQEKAFQNLLLCLREDGYFGFLGGTADPGESELECLRRECIEEGNFVIDEMELTRVSEHALPDGFKIILYHAAINKHEAVRILRNAVCAEHFFTETAGIVSVACHDKSRFIDNNFLDRVKLQIKEIGTLINDPTLIKWGNS